MTILLSIAVYFVLLVAISRRAARKADNATFFSGERRSPWMMVAFGMIGASISGISLVSVPGMVLHSQMTYLQLCIGFVFGYLVVAFVLLPVYYRLGLTSIYAYLGQRLGRPSYATGAWIFIISKLSGAAVKFYVVCLLLHQFVFSHHGVPFWLTVAGLVTLIWAYTRRGGVRSLVFTDTFQTLCLFGALFFILFSVLHTMQLDWSSAMQTVWSDTRSRVFVMDDWHSSQYFWKQLVSGIFIVVVMTGLDQDMMQKNLTCRTLREAQKDMCSYGVAFVPANLLLLVIGLLLAIHYESLSAAMPSADQLITTYVHGQGTALMVLFSIGIVAASFSSADSALTSLTTSFCIDIAQKRADERLRHTAHLVFCLLFAGFILVFHALNSTSLIDAIYIMVSYTYGPLLGLFAFGLLTSRRLPTLPHAIGGRLIPVVCIASPVVCRLLDVTVANVLGYRFGYELLLLNGMLTFCGLWAISLLHPQTKE